MEGVERGEVWDWEKVREGELWLINKLKNIK